MLTPPSLSLIHGRMLTTQTHLIDNPIINMPPILCSDTLIRYNIKYQIKLRKRHEHEITVYKSSDQHIKDRYVHSMMTWAKYLAIDIGIIKVSNFNGRFGSTKTKSYITTKKLFQVIKYMRYLTDNYAAYLFKTKNVFLVFDKVVI